MEPFQPLDESNVRMYVCGPTVYDRAHIGNARPIVVFDLLYRVLRSEYETVTYVRNLTDVDDKIIDRAKLEHPSVDINDAIGLVTGAAIKAFHDDCRALKVLPPTHEPRATNFISEMIGMISSLIKHGHAYVGGDGVYFDTTTFENTLFDIQVDETVTRLETSPHKRSQNDFVLWKLAKDGEPFWNSPWGHGRPGWHIECSAMGSSILGATFDIHGGGVDLKFPHHMNEHAQSCCANNTTNVASIWMHNEFVRINGQKMSKSLGNFFTVEDILTGKFDGERYSGDVVRLAILMSHYRDPLDISSDRFTEARKKLSAWRFATKGIQPTSISKTVLYHLYNDLDVYSMVNELDKLISDAGVLAATLDFLGLANEPNPEIDAIVEERLSSLTIGDYETSDRIRENLKSMNVVVSDYKENGVRKTKWIKV